MIVVHRPACFYIFANGLRTGDSLIYGAGAGHESLIRVTWVGFIICAIMECRSDRSDLPARLEFLFFFKFQKSVKKIGVNNCLTKSINSL